MILSWLKGRAPKPDVVIDADALQSAHGDQAYELARRHAREAHKAYAHWDAVRREIGRRTKPPKENQMPADSGSGNVIDLLSRRESKEALPKDIAPAELLLLVKLYLLIKSPADRAEIMTLARRRIRGG